MRLNVIVGNRPERLPRLREQIQTQGIDECELWDGIFVSSIKKSINLAHKQIVEYAMVAGFKETIIAEDDIKFTHSNSWKYFLSKIPDDYDLFLSMVYLGQPDENGIVKDFTGLTLYIVHSRFYETFLSVPEDEHLDRALSQTNGKFIVCNPFVAIQYNGHSSNTGKIESYDSLLAGRELYLGN